MEIGTESQEAIDLEHIALIAQFIQLAEPTKEWVNYINKSGIDIASAIAQGALLAVTRRSMEQRQAFLI